MNTGAPLLSSVFMSVPDFIRELRTTIGHDLLFLSAVEAVVVSDGRVLLAERADTGAWSIPGGIVEPGEFAADVAERELWEETGVRGTVDRLLLVTTTPPMAYPNGDRCQFLSMIFQCSYVTGEPRADGEETTLVRWFPTDALPDGLQEQDRRSIELALSESPTVFDRGR